MAEEEIKLELEKITEEQQKTNRRIDTMQKSLDLLFADREIFEDMQGRLTAIEEKMGLVRHHDETIRNDIKQEIQLSGDKVTAKVETKIDEIKSMVSKKKTVRPPTGKNWWTRFVESWV